MRGGFPVSWLPLPIRAKRRTRSSGEEPITVVIGNPAPIRRRPKGRGEWIESGSKNENKAAPPHRLDAAGGLGASEAHAKHLRNLYVYFWRWATWKVLRSSPPRTTPASCVSSPWPDSLTDQGFRRCATICVVRVTTIWVIDCSSEGHQPEVNTRIFQAVQQPYLHRDGLAFSQERCECPCQGDVSRVGKWPSRGKIQGSSRAAAGWTRPGSIVRPIGAPPFLPASAGRPGAAYPKLEDLFIYNGSGVMPGPHMDNCSGC